MLYLLISFSILNSFAEPGSVSPSFLESELNRLLIENSPQKPSGALGPPTESCGDPQKPESPPLIGQYVCEMDLPPEEAPPHNSPIRDPPGKKNSPSANPSDWPTKYMEVALYLDNDNKFMGLIPPTTPFSRVFSGNPDDKGYTHGLGIKLKHTNGKVTWGVDVASRLYTKTIDHAFLPAHTVYTTLNNFDAVSGKFISTQTNQTDYASHEVLAYSDPKGADGSPKEMVRFVDAERLEAFFRSGKEFYLKGMIGFEARERTRAPLAVAASIQDWWHGKVLKTYQYDYVTPDKQAPVTSGTVTSKSRYDDSAQLYDDKGNVIGNYPAQTVTEATSNYITYSRPGVAAEKLSTPVAPWSAIVGAAVGIEKEIQFSGKCHLKFSTEAGIKVETEATEILGPNSNAYLNSRATLGTRPNQKLGGASRYSISATQALIYYPRSIPDSGHLSTLTEIEVDRTSRMRGKSRVIPFILLQIPTGRQPFNEFNDDPGKLNSIMRFGVRIWVPGKPTSR